MSHEEQPQMSQAELEAKAAQQVAAQQSAPVQINYSNPNADLERQVLELQHRKLGLEIEQVVEDSKARNARLARGRETLEQRESQLSTERKQRQSDAKKCNHRQGGTKNRPMRGSGPTALKRINFPMGESIRCGVCRGQWFKPHPYEGVKRQRRGETEDQYEDRMERFQQANERFAELEEQMDAHAFTEEQSAVMETGAEFRFYTGEMQEVFPPRPNDTYALQYA